MPKILAFSGSARKDSYNQKLVKIAASGAEKAGAEVAVINLADFAMPIFNQDLEAAEGMPEKARQFKQLLIEHDGFLIASPEYNSAFSPLLKNAIDWASRRVGGEPPLVAYKGEGGGNYVGFPRRIRRIERPGVFKDVAGKYRCYGVACPAGRSSGG